MNCRTLLLSSAVALVASTGAANAGTSFHGWYVSLGAGANWIQDGDVTWTNGSYTYSWETGFITAASVGYSFDNHWRAEFEVAYRDNDGDRWHSKTRGGSDTTSANVWELSQMINVYYDFDLGGRWSASLGAGIGGNLVNLNWPGTGGDDDYVFAGQLIAQVAYQISERWQVYADYHFMMMEDPSFDANAGFPINLEKTDHAVMLGIRFDLQSDHNLVPEPERPMPAEPRRPKQFIVFFGFNKANLSAEAQRVVAEAAAAAKQYGSADIVVIGHTDTVGSPSYNMRLSMRRAGAVKAELGHQGIEPRMIHTSGKGETELMVQTGDGVKEPQNRRATIDLE